MMERERGRKNTFALECCVKINKKEKIKICSRKREVSALRHRRVEKFSKL